MIRQACSDDAAEIANVHVNSWRETYAGLLPQKFISELPLSFRRRRDYWESVIQKSPQNLLVAEEEKFGIVGFASVESARDPRLTGKGELTAIYLLRSFHGKGLGRDLLAAALGELKTRGFKEAYCWVLKDNPTIRFYQRSGASFLGYEKPDTIGGQSVTELAYGWTL